MMTAIDDVAATLDIEIDSLVLDAGYVSKNLIQAFHIGTEKTIIGRMPASAGTMHILACRRRFPCLARICMRMYTLTNTMP